MTNHVITTEEIDDDRSAWECSCGHGGSAPTWRVDLASDKHIEAGESRTDRYPAR